MSVQSTIVICKIKDRLFIITSATHLVALLSCFIHIFAHIWKKETITGTTRIYRIILTLETVYH